MIIIIIIIILICLSCYVGFSSTLSWLYVSPHIFLSTLLSTSAPIIPFSMRDQFEHARKRHIEVWFYIYIYIYNDLRASGCDTGGMKVKDQKVAKLHEM